MHSSIASDRLRSHRSHHLTLGWSDRMLNWVPKTHRGRKLTLKIRHVIFFCRNGLVLDHPRVTLSGQSYCPLLQDWGRLFDVNNQNCLSMASFCSRTMQQVIAIVVRKIWCEVGAGMCWHVLLNLQISPRVISDCLHVWKNIGVNIWIGRWYYRSCHGLFTSSEQRWIDSCNW